MPRSKEKWLLALPLLKQAYRHWCSSSLGSATPARQRVDAKKGGLYKSADIKTVRSNAFDAPLIKRPVVWASSSP